MKEYYNLTNAQMNILLTDKFYSGTGIANISGTAYINSDYDKEVLNQSINCIIKNNDALRIKIEFIDGEYKQYFSEYEEYNADYKEFENKEELNKFIKEQAQTPMNYINNLLFKFTMFKCKDGTNGCWILHSHLISDAWSSILICDQLVDNYIKLKKNEEVVDFSNFTYKNYIESENEYIKSEKYIQDKEYWDEKYNFMPEITTINSNEQMKNEENSCIANRIEIKVENTAKIEEYCKQNKISLYTFFLGIYSLYFSKLNNNEKIIFGTPVLNRKNISEKKTLGMFISTMPLLIDLTNTTKISELFQNIGKEILSEFRHQRYPYIEIVKNARNKFNFSSGLYDVIISYQNAKTTAKESEIDYNAKWNFNGNISETLNIHISDLDDKDELLLYYDYQVNKVDEGTILAINENISSIISQVIDFDDIGINEIQLINNGNDLLGGQNGFVNTRESLYYMFEKQVVSNGNKVAIRYEDKFLTYKELDEKVNSLAWNLLENGVNNKMPVMLVLDRSLEMIISMLAVLKIGAYYIPIDQSWPAERRNYIFEDSGCKYILANEKYIDNDLEANWIGIESIDISTKRENIVNKSKPGYLAYVIYTSGSTGKPKGVLITNRNVVGLLKSTHKIFKQTNEDIWTLFHTYTFDFSTWEIYGCINYGGELIIVPKDVTTNPQKFLDLIIKNKVTFLNQTPAYFYKVIEQEKILNPVKDDIKIKYVILGGENVTAKPLIYWKNKYENVIIYNGYGPTETTIFAIMGEITKEDIMKNNICIGTPLDKYSVKVVDSNMNEVPDGKEGEFIISGIGVCNGYLNNEAMTKDRFVYEKEKNIRIYKSGDVGYIDSDGRIKYIGRNDFQVKIRGFRIEIEEIEKQIINCENVNKVIVFPVDDENYTKKLIGFIEASKENCVNEVLQEIKKKLTPYMIPKLYQVKEFPLNDNGKVDKKKLIALIKEEKREIINPQNEIEQEIYESIMQISQKKSISIKDDFFLDIGLDSLDMMQIATKLSKYYLSVQDINDNPNIEDLAKIIKDGKNLTPEKNNMDIEIVNKTFSFNMTNVLVTGVTGFLGANIVKELINCSSVKKVYCLIRRKNGSSANQRLLDCINYYFTKNEIKNISKLEVVVGDFEEENFGLDQEKIEKLKKITTIIHSGANVKHYGKYKDFYRTNVQGTINVLNFAKLVDAKVAHISTVSVGGFSLRTDNKVLDELSLNIDQAFNDHVYMLTKYEAECEVLKKVYNNEVDAKIFRMGNIMPRYADGIFQVNKLDNGFLCRLKSLIETNGIVEMYEKNVIDLSPVDFCAEAIISLMENESKLTIYNVLNNNVIEVGKIVEKYNFDKITVSEQIDRIQKLSNPYNGHLLSDLLNIEYRETLVSNELTLKQLAENGFKWNFIDDEYLKKIYRIVEEVK